MSEHPSSHDFAWQMAHEANEVFDTIRQAGDMATTGMVGEFVTLQTMAGAVFAPHTSESIQTKLTWRQQAGLPIENLMDDLRRLPGFTPPGTPRIQTRTLNVLFREDIHTLRDVIVIGRNAISDIRVVGDTSMDILQYMIETVVPDITWPAHPEAPLAARFFSSVEEIPARVFSPYCISIKGMETVGDLLKLDVPTAIRLVSAHYKHYQGVHFRDIVDEGKRLHTRINNFAAQFRQTKAQQARRH